MSASVKEADIFIIADCYTIIRWHRLLLFQLDLHRRRERRT